MSKEQIFHNTQGVEDNGEKGKIDIDKEDASQEVIPRKDEKGNKKGEESDRDKAQEEEGVIKEGLDYGGFCDELFKRLDPLINNWAVRITPILEGLNKIDKEIEVLTKSGGKIYQWESECNRVLNSITNQISADIYNEIIESFRKNFNRSYPDYKRFQDEVMEIMRTAEPDDKKGINYLLDNFGCFISYAGVIARYDKLSEESSLKSNEKRELLAELREILEQMKEASRDYKSMFEEVVLIRRAERLLENKGISIDLIKWFE